MLNRLEGLSDCELVSRIAAHVELEVFTTVGSSETSITGTCGGED